MRAFSFPCQDTNTLELNLPRKKCRNLSNKKLALHQTQNGNRGPVVDHQILFDYFA